jgi:hypothetical protein
VWARQRTAPRDTTIVAGSYRSVSQSRIDSTATRVFPAPVGRLTSETGVSPVQLRFLTTAGLGYRYSLE